MKYKATNKELIESDLKHYKEISNKAMVYHSSIPKAIKQYYKEDYSSIHTQTRFFILGVVVGAIISAFIVW